MTGALLPVGVPAKPGQMIKATVPCGGSVMRVKMTDKGSDGIYPHNKMEVYAFGFRNQSGVAFGPKGTRFENALAVSDNGANDLGHRRIANSGEKLFIVTEKGQDAGFPDKDGFGFVTNKRSSLHPLDRLEDRASVSATLHRRPALPAEDAALQFPVHVDGIRGVPLIGSNPNPNGYINPVMEWDTNNPMDGIAWSSPAFGTEGNACLPRSTASSTTVRKAWCRPGRSIVQVDFLHPTGVKWNLRPQHRHGAERVPEAGEPGRAGAHQRCRLQQRRQDHVRGGLWRAVHRLHHAHAVLRHAEVRRDLGDHQAVIA